MGDLEGLRVVDLDRDRKTPAQLADLRARLRNDRQIVKSRGHDWDVADIMAVVEVWNEESA